jgi:hypothetical protein
MTTLGLAGDNMLGRKVAAILETESPTALFAPAVAEIAAQADLLILKPRVLHLGAGRTVAGAGQALLLPSTPAAIEALALLAVDCVTLANHYALDYGPNGTPRCVRRARSGRDRVRGRWPLISITRVRRGPSRPTGYG